MNKRILIIDDNPGVRLGYHMSLKANNYDTFFAVDAYTSMVEAQKQPDLIILDLGAGGDGFSVMETLQAMPHLAMIPIIVVSVAVSDAYSKQKRALHVGAKAFLEKPVNHEDLLVIIRRYVDTRNDDQITSPPRGVVVPV